MVEGCRWWKKKRACERYRSRGGLERKTCVREIGRINEGELMEMGDREKI